MLTLAALAFGRWADRAHRQRTAALAFRAAGATLKYSDSAVPRFEPSTGYFWFDEPDAARIAVSESSFARDFIYDVLAIYPPPVPDATKPRRVSDAEMSLLGSLPGLLELVLPYDNDITPIGIAHVKSCPRLRFLNLSGTPVNDECIKHIIRLSSLVRLDLTDTDVTDRGALSLASMPNLRVINLYGSLVSKVTVQELRQRLPRCEVNYSPRG